VGGWGPWQSAVPFTPFLSESDVRLTHGVIETEEGGGNRGGGEDFMVAAGVLSLPGRSAYSSCEPRRR
jgi:hypothetical protein